MEKVKRKKHESWKEEEVEEEVKLQEEELMYLWFRCAPEKDA